MTPHLGLDRCYELYGEFVLRAFSAHYLSIRLFSSKTSGDPLSVLKALTFVGCSSLSCHASDANVRVWWIRVPSSTNTIDHALHLLTESRQLHVFSRRFVGLDQFLSR